MDVGSILSVILDFIYAFLGWRRCVSLFAGIGATLFAETHIASEPLNWIVGTIIMLVSLILGRRWEYASREN